MSARASVQALLEGELTPGARLRDLGFETAYGSNAVDTPTEEMFLIVRWEDQTPQFGNRGPQRLTVWAHSKDRDYSPIDLALGVVKDLLGGATHLAGADGWILTQADWRGDSQDLYDDGFGTITRNSGFDVVSRYATTQI